MNKIYKSNIDWTHFVSETVWNALAQSNSSRQTRRRCITNLKILINHLIKRIYNLYQSKCRFKRTSETYKSNLLTYGLLKHGNFNEQTAAERTLRKRVKCIKQCIQYQNSLVLDALDLREKHLLCDIRKNSNSYQVLLPKFELIFIRQQNKLNKVLSRDVEYGCALTMAGILNNWSNETWRKFNLYVCAIL